MRLALVIMLTTLVATCGQKGPLRLPEPQASVSALPLQGAIAARTNVA